MENTATVSGTEVKKYRRAGFMDEVRGFCILCMVVYHVCFDLNYTYNIHIPIMFDGWFDIVRDIFADIMFNTLNIGCLNVTPQKRTNILFVFTLSFHHIIGVLRNLP